MDLHPPLSLLLSPFQQLKKRSLVWRLERKAGQETRLGSRRHSRKLLMTCVSSVKLTTSYTQKTMQASRQTSTAPSLINLGRHLCGLAYQLSSPSTKTMFPIRPRPGLRPAMIQKRLWRILKAENMVFLSSTESRGFSRIQGNRKRGIHSLSKFGAIRRRHLPLLSRWCTSTNTWPSCKRRILFLLCIMVCKDTMRQRKFPNTEVSRVDHCSNCEKRLE